jgi:hypothetical protein
MSSAQRRDPKIHLNDNSRHWLLLLNVKSNADTSDESFSHKSYISDRVNRLGEFSPTGQLFTLGGFFENYKKSKNFGLLLPRLCINLDKNWVGLHFGRFFDKLIWSPWFQKKHVFQVQTNFETFF